MTFYITNEMKSLLGVNLKDLSLYLYNTDKDFRDEMLKTLLRGYLFDEKDLDFIKMWLQCNVGNCARTYILTYLVVKHFLRKIKNMKYDLVSSRFIRELFFDYKFLERFEDLLLENSDEYLDIFWLDRLDQVVDNEWNDNDEVRLWKKWRYNFKSFDKKDLLKSCYYKIPEPFIYADLVRGYQPTFARRVSEILVEKCLDDNFEESLNQIGLFRIENDEKHCFEMFDKFIALSAVEKDLPDGKKFEMLCRKGSAEYEDMIFVLCEMTNESDEVILRKIYYFDPLR